jgi:hypothetical protein
LDLGGRVESVDALSDGVCKRTGNREERDYFEQAIGSSQLPGTDWTTMFDSFTPEARSLALVPARRGSIIAREEEH